MQPVESLIRRFSSRRQKLDRSFLTVRLQGALAYDRIAGYFSSSLLEVAGEALDSVSGKIRVVCNSDLDPKDVQTARAAQNAIWQSWAGSAPEALVHGNNEGPARDRFARLYTLLQSNKLEVRVLPDPVYGLIHGKAGVITLADGSKTSFMGSANESKSAWRLNYELVWEDPSPDAVAWVQEEFDALWGSPFARPLAEAVVEDIGRIARRRVLWTVPDWEHESSADEPLDPAPALVEAPVYRKEVGLWAHQKYFVKTVFDAHRGPTRKARFVLADQVGLGKTLQLAMSAQLIALTGDKPILIICPKPLIWQWQGEMRDLLDMPSAVWDGRRWIDENGIEYPVLGAEGIRKCPRRVGIISNGLIKRRSEAVGHLLKFQYDCVILDEAHHARRRNLGDNSDGEAPVPNNLLRFMYELAERTRSLLLATATPVQLRPVEAWDLLDVLSRGDPSVLGDMYSRWRRADRTLNLVMKSQSLPTDEAERWEWLRNPMPPKSEHRDFEILRRDLGVGDDVAVVPGHLLGDLRPPALVRMNNLYPRLMDNHNPFIRRIVRRTRQQLEEQRDPVNQEPLLKRINVELLGEGEDDAIRLPIYLKGAYKLAEEFTQLIGERLKNSGFLRTLLLRRMGSTIYAGTVTAQRMLGDWEHLEEEDEEDETENDTKAGSTPVAEQTRTLTPAESGILERLIESLEQNRARDPKYAVVVDCLRKRGWLELGCIIFSQYRDSIRWLAEQLTEEFPNEPIGLYSGPSTSGIMQGGNWQPAQRELLKERVRRGELRLLLGTDAASEGLNLQKLARLINLDLPWNPTRLEQRKGRIQRIGQVHDTVQIYNMRYKDSVEDRVHELLSTRLQDIYTLFGQLPDVLEDAWIALAQGEKDAAQKIIDAVPQVHPFELRYTEVEPIDWETCSAVLDGGEKRRVLRVGW
jgi:superfamily II DNA or RNA helicase